MANSEAIRVLGISGSLRRESFNTRALTAAAGLCPAGMTIDLGTLADSPPRNPIADFPLYDDDAREQAIPEAVTAMASRIAEADALLIATPEYNYSIPGALKNAIDWISRLPNQPFKDKPFAVMGAARGPVGTARVQYHLRQVAVFLEALPLNKPEVMISFAPQRFDETGRLVDDDTRGFMTAQLEALLAWTLRVRRS